MVAMDWTNKEYETVFSMLSGSLIELVKQRYNPEHDYLLTLKKHKNTNERLKPDQTTTHKTNQSDRTSFAK
jgi:hypothetical protein